MTTLKRASLAIAATVTCLLGDPTRAEAMGPTPVQVRLTDIDAPLVPTRLEAGDREFGGHGPDITCSLDLSLSPDATKVIATIDFKAKETVSDWSTTRAHWTRTVYTAPAGRKIASIESPTHSAVHFLSRRAGFQILFPGEDLAKFLFRLQQVAEQIALAHARMVGVPITSKQYQTAHDLVRQAEQGLAGLVLEGNYVHTVAPESGPVRVFAIVGDTGGPDISTDLDGKDDTRVVAVKFQPIRLTLK